MKHKLHSEQCFIRYRSLYVRDKKTRAVTAWTFDVSTAKWLENNESKTAVIHRRLARFFSALEIRTFMISFKLHGNRVPVRLETLLWKIDRAPARDERGKNTRGARVLFP